MSIAARFDVHAYARTAHGSLRQEFDAAEFARYPLDREAIVATAYLRGLELAGIAPLRGLAAAGAAPRLDAFVATWASEKGWIVQALDDVLAASPRIRGVGARRRGAAGSHAHPPTGRLPLPLRGVTGPAVDRLLGPIAAAFALDAQVMIRGYRRLAHLSLHPEMERLAGAVVPVLERHADFFTEEAAERLADSRPSRALVRATLPALRLPLAEQALPPELAREGRDLVFAGDAEGLTSIDLLAGRRFGVPSSAALRVASPHEEASLRLGRQAGAVLAELRWSLQGRPL